MDNLTSDMVTWTSIWVRESWNIAYQRVQDFDPSSLDAPSCLATAAQSVTDHVTGLARWEYVHVWLIVCVCVLGVCLAQLFRIRSEPSLQLPDESSTHTVFDIAKTAYEPGHVEALISLVRKRSFDVNSTLPNSGLTLFLCACLSGQRKLVEFLLKKGADPHAQTLDGDSALYLATFGVMNMTDALYTSCPDTGLLEELMQAGCSVNAQNSRGYTPLHRAASRGNVQVVRCLLDNGADPYLATTTGVYPIDLATNAGHLEAAELLAIELDDRSVWDIVEPHTPTRVRLGLQSPGRKHLAESTAPRAGLRHIREI